MRPEQSISSLEGFGEVRTIEDDRKVPKKLGSYFEAARFCPNLLMPIRRIFDSKVWPLLYAPKSSRRATCVGTESGI